MRFILEEMLHFLLFSLPLELSVLYDIYFIDMADSVDSLTLFENSPYSHEHIILQKNFGM